MAISPTTDWSKIRYIMLLIFAVSVLLSSTVATGLATSGKQKRQLFREHLLPEQGGKIPDGALRLERVSLNRLTHHGLYTIDGKVFENSLPEYAVHHHPKQFVPQTLKINVPPEDNRYASPEGGNFGPRTVDTTYLIRHPASYNIRTTLHTSHLPTIPYSSLSLLKMFQQQRFNKLNSVRKDDLSTDSSLPARVRSFIFSCRSIIYYLIFIICIFFCVSKRNKDCRSYTYGK